MSWSIAFGIGEHSGGGCMTVLITATHDEDGQCLEMKEIRDGDRVIPVMGNPFKLFGYFRMTNA
jgi:hypothetical protein